MSAPERDSAGRLAGAPARDGDLAVLSPAGLAQRDKGLVAHIANLTVKFDAAARGLKWTVRSQEQRQAHEVGRWVEQLVAVRNERIRRGRTA